LRTIPAHASHSSFSSMQPENASSPRAMSMLDNLAGSTGQYADAAQNTCHSIPNSKLSAPKVLLALANDIIQQLLCFLAQGCCALRCLSVWLIIQAMVTLTNRQPWSQYSLGSCLVRILIVSCQQLNPEAQRSRSVQIPTRGR
jgi:hypothetical protein